jgi:PKD repeat protein
MKSNIFIYFLLIFAHYAQAQVCPPMSGNFTFTIGPDGATVAFVEDINSCESGGYTISWDFDDGSPLVTGTSPTHVYSEEGTYMVYISVKLTPQFRAKLTPLKPSFLNG